MLLFIEIIVEPIFGVYADVSLVVDATNANDIEGSINEFETLFGDQWNVKANSVFITSVPSTSPSTTPIVFPTTLLPSAQPSITGLVVTIDVTNVATSPLTRLELNQLSNTVIDAFDVSPNDVTTEVAYTTSGSLSLLISEASTEDEITEGTIASLAELLNVHPRDVTITSVDLSTGKVEYEISTDSFAETSRVQADLEALSNDNIEDAMQEFIPSLEVYTNDIDDDIEVKLLF